MIYHISYVSRSTDRMHLEELGLLEELASKNNGAVDVTGFLVYDGYNFFQYIEGSQENVETVFNRIKEDPRHVHITELSRGEAQDRLLAQWSMKCFMPGDFIASERVHIMDLLCAKHEKESIGAIVSSLRFAGNQ